MVAKPTLEVTMAHDLLPLQHTAAQLVLNNLRAEQKRLREKAEKEIAEQTRRLDEARACYQNLSVDLQKSELTIKGAEEVTKVLGKPLPRHKP